MFPESDVKSFHYQKLWYDLCLAIQEKAETHTSNSVQAYYDYVLPNENHIHPYTFCKTTLVLSDLLEPESSQKLLCDATNTIKSNEYISEEKEKTLLKLSIRFHENNVHLNLDEGIENFIYDKKRVRMDKETTHVYYRLSYKYYAWKEDFEECCKHFEKYIDGVVLNEKDDESPKTEKEIREKAYKSLYSEDKKDLAYNLVKFSLVNPKSINFTAVTLHKMYQFLSDAVLKELFENVMIGNVGYVLDNKKTIERILPNSFDLLREKVYLISFINLCFYNKERMISIEEIMQHLNLDRKHVFYVLLKAFGLNLVKGTIDGDHDIVKFTYVIPRILNKDEIIVLKRKFESWSERIGNMIKLAE